MYAYDAKSDGVEESEWKAEGSIGERVKLKKHMVKQMKQVMNN